MRFLVSLLVACFVSQASPAEPPAAKAPKVPSRSLKVLAASLTSVQTITLMNLINRGDHLSLVELPGIGTVRAEAIQRARPFVSPLGLLQVPGIGEATLTEILNHAKAGYPRIPPKTRAALK